MQMPDDPNDNDRKRIANDVPREIGSSDSERPDTDIGYSATCGRYCVFCSVITGNSRGVPSPRRMLNTKHLAISAEI